MLDIQQFQLHLTSLAKICQKVNTILVNRPGHPFYSSTFGVLPRSAEVRSRTWIMWLEKGQEPAIRGGPTG